MKSLFIVAGLLSFSVIASASDINVIANKDAMAAAADPGAQIVITGQAAKDLNEKLMDLMGVRASKNPAKGVDRNITGGDSYINVEGDGDTLEHFFIGGRCIETAATKDVVCTIDIKNMLTAK